MTPTLRPITKADLAQLVNHANNKAISDQLTDAFPFPYTEEHGRSFIKMTEQNDPRNILAITVKNELIGAIGIHPKTDIDRMNAEMGYWIAETYWGKESSLRRSNKWSRTPSAFPRYHPDLCTALR